MKRSKLYRSRLAAVDRQTTHAIEDALRVLKEMPTAKFDETVELVFRLGIDPKQSDQVIRGAMVLPRGTGKEVRVVVIAEGDAATAAAEAGADEVGFEELLERIKGGWLGFDVIIATPAAMKRVRALGRVLGPRGLMPNPKTGTVTDDTATAVKQAKAGRVEYRCDRGGCIHVLIGKLSFSQEALLENATALVQVIQRQRPSAAKGIYLQALTVCATMSPGIKIDIKSVAEKV
ncbi:MAG: 50S ribosomal protein L1 [Desulfobacteraceae bacterium]|nr:50S ribosomal protein L1 [Desulfobacteraceae bacterium]